MQPLIKAIKALHDNSVAPAFVPEDSDDDVCDAAVDEEEPEAGTMGQIITKKINKFENCQTNDAEYRSRSDLDRMVRIVKAIQERKEAWRERKDDINEIIANPNYQGVMSRYQSNQ